MVLVKPDFQISTREVYQSFRLEKVNKSPDNPAFLAAWRNYDIINVAQEMNNVLETVSIEEHPEIALIKQQLLASGALNALMSGSGPTVFGLYASLEEAGRAFKNMQDQYKEAFLVSSYKRSERHDG